MKSGKGMDPYTISTLSGNDMKEKRRVIGIPEGNAMTRPAILDKNKLS